MRKLSDSEAERRGLVIFSKISLRGKNASNYESNKKKSAPNLYLSCSHPGAEEFDVRRISQTEFNKFFNETFLGLSAKQKRAIKKLMNTGDFICCARKVGR